VADTLPEPWVLSSALWLVRPDRSALPEPYRRTFMVRTLPLALTPPEPCRSRLSESRRAARPRSSRPEPFRLATVEPLSMPAALIAAGTVQARLQLG
jgi:hypothetical protein